MTEHENRKAYACSFVSYLLRSIRPENIGRIILYGSAAKSQATKESDIDIFIDLKKETQKSKAEISKILAAFSRSKEAIIFKLLGVENDVSLKIGMLDKWPGLKRSILSDGIVLWGKFETREKPRDTEHKVIFFWDRIAKNRTAFLNKLYGYRSKKAEYTGLLERWSASKLGKSCILIPIQYRDEMVGILKKYRVRAQTIEVFC